MKNVSISIIIPAYNVAGYIEVCLDSILAQTYSDYEVIVVDDGSTDATGAIIDRYARTDDRIVAIHKQNEGVSAARNTGIEVAAGEFFLFFDGDDFSEPYTCEELVKTIREKQVDVLIYGYHRYRDGQVTQICLPMFPEGYYEDSAIIPKLLAGFVGVSLEGINRWILGVENGLYVENPALWRCIIKAEVIRSNKLQFDINLKVGEDTIFISDLLSCAKRCYVLHKCYYYLVFRENSTIAAYEKDAVAKLAGKQRLIAARYALTDRVMMSAGIDVKPWWQGSVIMSVLELAFLLAKKSAGEMPLTNRYRLYLQYARRDEVKDAMRAYKPKYKLTVKLVPLLMLKLGLHFPLFLCAAFLNMIRYEFIRG